MIRRLVFFVVWVVCLGYSSVSSAQNWSLVIRDNGSNTPNNRVNGISGSAATLFATIFNFTGSPISDDGTGTQSPAPATTLDFAGFGFTLFPGQYDLESLFTPDLRIPGWPIVIGSLDGVTPGTSGYISLGTFDVSGLSSGIYEEDFEAGAYTHDPNSTIPFDSIHGTIQLNVVEATSVPEISPLTNIAILVLTLFGIVGLKKRKRFIKSRATVD